MKKKTRIGLIAGGTGITPMFSVAQAIVLSNDLPLITFLFSNKTKDDILCKDDIDHLANQAPN